MESNPNKLADTGCLVISSKQVSYLVSAPFRAAARQISKAINRADVNFRVMPTIDTLRFY